LANLKMNFPYIDQYVARFKDLAHNASYTVGNSETINIFLCGLDPGVLNTVLNSENVDTYDQIKQRAISATRSKQLIGTLQTRAPTNNLAFQNYKQFANRNPTPHPPTRFHNRSQPQAQNQRQYNSTNVPRWMNNTPVPMDLSRAHAPNHRYNSHGNVAQTGGPNSQQCTKGPCFNCGKAGHFTCECYAKQNAPRTQQINVMDEENEPLDYPTLPISKIDRTMTAIAHYDTLSDEEAQEVIDRTATGASQSFHKA
jgi:hypothetical protein